MSQSDSFIDEVTEEVRRDKLFATFKKYGWIAILLVLVIVGAAAWNEYRRAQDTAAAEAFGDAMLSALEQGEPAERATALGAIDTESAAGRAVLDLIQAAELSNGGDDAAAVALLNGVADDAAVPVFYRALAQFRALVTQTTTMTPAERRAGYEDLAGPGAPLRLLAMEQIAMTHVEEGNRDAALTQLNGLLEQAGATPDLLRRVSQLIVSLGGTPGAQSN